MGKEAQVAAMPPMTRRPTLKSHGDGWLCRKGAGCADKTWRISFDVYSSKAQLKRPKSYVRETEGGASHHRECAWSRRTRQLGQKTTLTGKMSVRHISGAACSVRLGQKKPFTPTRLGFLELGRERSTTCPSACQSCLPKSIEPGAC